MKSSLRRFVDFFCPLLVPLLLLLVRPPPNSHIAVVVIQAFSPSPHYNISARSSRRTAAVRRKRNNPPPNDFSAIAHTALLRESNDDNDSNNEPEKPKDVKIVDPTVVPTIPPDMLLDVSYAEQAIQALGTIGEVVEAYHAGIVFTKRSGVESSGATITEGDGVPEEFTIEWYALNFPFGAFLPDVDALKKEKDEGEKAEDYDDGTGLRWVNEAHAFYSPIYDPNRWSKGRTLIGTIDGAGFAQYAQWIVDFCQQRPGYQAFEVWDHPNLIPGKTVRWVGSSTCSTFVEESLRELYRLGGTCAAATAAKGVATPRELLRRSYAPLVSKSSPTKVNLSDPKEAAEVREFYVQLSKAARGGNTDNDENGGLSTSDFIRLLADKLEVFYVYDTPSGDYYRIELDPPYFALANLYQPMSVPWQRLDLNGDGDLEDPAEFAPMSTTERGGGASFSEELSSAASGVADLLKRRLPPVLKRRFLPKLAKPALGVASVAAVAAVVMSQPTVDASFASGLLVGVVVGAAGSKVLGK